MFISIMLSLRFYGIGAHWFGHSIGLRSQGLAGRMGMRRCDVFGHEKLVVRGDDLLGVPRQQLVKNGYS